MTVATAAGTAFAASLTAATAFVTTAPAAALASTAAIEDPEDAAQKASSATIRVEAAIPTKKRRNFPASAIVGRAGASGALTSGRDAGFMDASKVKRLLLVSRTN
jgi:hypothetical protein